MAGPNFDRSILCIYDVITTVVYWARDISRLIYKDTHAGQLSYIIGFSLC